MNWGSEGWEIELAVRTKGVQFQVRVESARRVKVTELVVPLLGMLPVPVQPEDTKRMPFVSTKAGTWIGSLVFWPCRGRLEEERKLVNTKNRPLLEPTPAVFKSAAKQLPASLISDCAEGKAALTFSPNKSCCSKYSTLLVGIN